MHYNMLEFGQALRRRMVMKPKPSEEMKIGNLPSLMPRWRLPDRPLETANCMPATTHRLKRWLPGLPMRRTARFLWKNSSASQSLLVNPVKLSIVSAKALGGGKFVARLHCG